MILRTLICMLALVSSLTSELYAGAERAERLVEESGGILGIAGVSGIPGVPGIFAFSDFFALMPGDNSATVAPGTPVMFPQNGPTSGLITRLNASQFLLSTVGTYYVHFQVSVNEPGQLEVSINGAGIANTVTGRATGTSQIVGTSFVTTTTPNSILEIINPVGNSTALTITPVAGGTHSVSAHLVIIRVL
jgi:hypothetical protein